MKLVKAASSTGYAPSPGRTAHTLDFIPPEQTAAYRTLRRTMVLGGGAALALLCCAGFLLLNTVIAGAVVTNGVLVVERGSQKVQHPTGGVVSKLLVHEDDVVKAGQPLVVLDDTVPGARVHALSISLSQQRARLTRLEAERANLSDPFFPIFDPAMEISRDEYASIVSNERLQFSVRREERDGQRAQLSERITQAAEGVSAAKIQLKAVVEERALIAAQVTNLGELRDKQLIGGDRLIDLQRTLLQLTGQEGSLQASMVEGTAKIAELKQMVAQIDLALRTELADQITAAQGQVADLSEQLVIAKDQLRRSIVSAPTGGVVHELNVHTIGGVVQPGETLMVVVPANERLLSEVRISPADIDQVYPGQAVLMHFSAFDRGTTPALDGHLVSVSPDLVTDQRGNSYYVGRAQPEASELAKLPADLKLVPGMPVEVFIKTDQRTILSYLLKPLSDQLERAFR